MINFGIPSSFKAHIDYVLRPGVTFKYTQEGPGGLVNGKKVYLVLSRGGVYTQGPMQSFNFQDPYLRASLGFIGLNDIEVIATLSVPLFSRFTLVSRFGLATSLKLPDIAALRFGVGGLLLVPALIRYGLSG